MPIEPVEEPLVPVNAIGPRVIDVPMYHRAGLPGALPRNWLREGVAARLAAVAGGLPDGMTLVVWDGYRPIATQAALFNGYLDELTMVHPDWPADALEDAAARYVTPPSRSALAPPPHLTGGAVDLTLGDGDGRPLDLGTDFDAFVPEAGARALEAIPGQRPGPAAYPLLGDGRAGVHAVRRGVVALRPRRPVLGPGDRPGRPVRGGGAAGGMSAEHVQAAPAPALRDAVVRLAGYPTARRGRCASPRCRARSCR